MTPNSYLEQIITQEERAIYKLIEQFNNHETTNHLCHFGCNIIGNQMSRLLMLRRWREHYV